MTTAAKKPATEGEPKRTGLFTPVPEHGYVAGEHTARVRSEHDARRRELLARDEVLAAEIKVREEERHDIGEALNLCSMPALESNNVTHLRAAGE